MNAAGSSEHSAVESGQARSPGASAAAETLTPGELLRRERERRSISLLQAAEDLHLDTRVVEAIEANRFDLLGAPVYARGHLRKYASLLGLSPEFILQRYEALTDRPEVPMPVPASVTTGAVVELERRGSLKGPLWVSFALIVLALGWWIFDQVMTPSVTEAVQSMLSLPPSEEAPPTPEESSTSLVPSVAPAVTNSAAPAVRVRLSYSRESWTEIYDANGQRLMFDLGEKGRVHTVSGTPPLRITLGNASAVTVQVNDRSVVVPRQSGRDSAKFVITASGAVQP